MINKHQPQRPLGEKGGHIGTNAVMVNSPLLIVAAPVAGKVAHFVFNAGVNVLGIDLRLQTAITQPLADDKGMAGNGITLGRTGQELVKGVLAHSPASCSTRISSCKRSISSCCDWMIRVSSLRVLIR